MEMDLGSVIIGAIAIIICALPFAMMSIGRKKSEKIFLKSLSEMATRNNCRLSQHDLLGIFAIGIDETKGFVFFYRQTKDSEIEQIVDLSEIQSCKVINKSRSFKNKAGNQKVIERLELSFIPIVKTKPEIKMEFFNADVGVQLNGELQSIDKWSKLINDRLVPEK